MSLMPYFMRELLEVLKTIFIHIFLVLVQKLQNTHFYTFKQIWKKTSFINYSDIINAKNRFLCQNGIKIRLKTKNYDIFVIRIRIRK